MAAPALSLVRGDRKLERAMARALELAARAGGRTSPNPKVGAVALDYGSGAIVAEGFHRAPGEAHAETALLRDAAARGVTLSGSTLVCTLEPCVHHGRTPPCAPQVAAAGFAWVALAMRDPNPAVNGRGVQLLRAGGIEVVEGVRLREARRLNEGFARWISTGLPFVHLKVAMLADGTVYRGPALPREISSAEARRLVHTWRHLAGAVLVGSSTIVVDDPLLTARHLPPGLAFEPWQPRRVVLSTRFDVPHAARALRVGEGEFSPLVIGAAGSDPVGRRVLHEAGIETHEVPAAPGGVDLAAAVRVVGERGITEVLVEAGPTLADALLQGGLVDRLSVFVAAPAATPGAGSPSGWRRWTPPGGLPFRGDGLLEREELTVGRDTLITGLVRT